MQIKKYTAPTLKEAAGRMKEELGSDAVILGTRIIEGDARFKGIRVFEITAGIDEPVSAKPAARISRTADKEEKEYSAEIKKLNDKIYKRPAPLNTPRPAEPKPTAVKKTPDTAPVKVNAGINNEIKEIVELLRYREVSETVIKAIIGELKKYKSFLTKENIDNYVISSIASLITTHQFELKKQKMPKVISMVGPTGVGKTTCIAKLAVISKILHNLDVGLISIDTYRLGALDQLRIFSEISSTDMLVAYEPEEMPALLNKFKKKDIIFIDTAGRSQNSALQLKETKRFLEAGSVNETHLVLSATGSSRNLADVAEKFKIFNYKSVMFTKVDEAASYGSMMNLLYKFGIPVMFLTNGQVIPDDIISADAEFIARMIFKGKITK